MKPGPDMDRAVCERIGISGSETWRVRVKHPDRGPYILIHLPEDWGYEQG